MESLIISISDMSVKYHLYTIRHIREWLYNDEQNGLSEDVISKVRANAIAHNPYVDDNTLAVVVAKDDERLVGYTAMFPDCWARPKMVVSVATTLWVDPDYADEFVSYYLTQALRDNPIGNLIGADAAPASVLVDKLLGLNARMTYRSRYVMNRNLKVRSFRNFCSLLIEPFRLMKQRLAWRNVRIDEAVKVEYCNFIDKQTYNFIEKHSDDDVLLRSHEMLNWIMQYPFAIDSPLIDNITSQNRFRSNIENRKNYFVKVFFKEMMIGFFSIYMSGKDAYLRMLYYEKGYEERVSEVIMAHVGLLKPEVFRCHYMPVMDYVDKMNLALKKYKEEFSFTYPKTIGIDIDKRIQAIDGDMFA